MYKFRIADEKEEDELRNGLYGGEWIYRVGVREEVYALFLGKVIARFGKNDTLCEDWENMYNYSVVAEDEQGEKLLVIIYHGPGGPSYSIPTDFENDDIKSKYEQAAKELVEYIENAEPADYVHESVYEDVGVNIKYTVKNGTAAVESEMPEDFDPEDFM